MKRLATKSEDAKCADHCWLRVKFRILKCPSSRFYVQADWICKHWPTSEYRSAVNK
jgi:hypothetical protein